MDFPVGVNVSSLIGLFTADGRVVLAEPADRKAFEIVELTSPTQVRSTEVPVPRDLPGLWSAAIASGGSRAALLTIDDDGGGGVAVVFDIATRKFLPYRIPVDAGTPETRAAAIGLSADGHTLFIGDRKGVLRTYATQTGASAADPLDTGRPITMIGSPSGNTPLLTAASAPAENEPTDRIDVVDPRTGQRVASVTLNLEPPLGPPVVSPDGNRLIIGLSSGDVIIWDIPRDRQIARHSVTEGPISLVAVSPDGQHLLASDASNGSATLWPMDGTPADGVRLDVDVTGTVYGAFRDGGRRIVTVSDRGRPLLWDVEDSTLVQLACDIVRRDLTAAEWTAVLPSRPHQATCTR